MAAKTTAQAGDYGTGATWTGGVVPVDGDTLTITHAVTLSDARTVGHSPGASDGTAAVLISTGGSFTITGSGVLTCRGDFNINVANAAALTMNAGAQFIFDPSAAGTPSTAKYRLMHSTGVAGTVINGTSGSHCVLKTNTAGGGGTAWVSNAATGFQGIKTMTYCEITDMGDTTNPGVYVIGVTTSASASWTHNSFLRVGKPLFNMNSNTTGTIVFEDNIFTSSVLISTFACDFRFNAAKSSGTRSIARNSFDDLVSITETCDVTCTDNYFAKGLNLSSNSARNGFTLFENNLVRKIVQGTQQMQSSVLNCYFLKDATAGAINNPHFLTCPTDRGATIDGVVFHTSNSDDAGDCCPIPSPGSARTYTIQNCLVLPDTNTPTRSSGNLPSLLGNANCTVAINHNTLHGNANFCTSVGETYAGHAGLISSFKSNLCIGLGAGSGRYKLADSGSNDAVSDLVASGDANYNGGTNLSAGSNLKGYNNLEFSSGSPGANDIDADPQFVANTRHIGTWGSTLHATDGSITAALAVIAADPTLIDSMIEWVKAGFAPTNSVYQNAGHDGVTTGAVEGVFSTGRPAKMLLLGVGG